MKEYLLARARERSSWRGLVLIATALGAHWSPESQEAIITGGIAIAGMLGALLPDTTPKGVEVRVVDAIAASPKVGEALEAAAASAGVRNQRRP